MHNVLITFFCVIGNGYEWNELGQLESDYRMEDMPNIDELKSHLVDGVAHQHNLIKNKRKLLLHFANTEKDKSRKKIFLELAKNADGRDAIEEDRKNMWYFRHPSGSVCTYKDYAYIWNLPENIAPDWLKAANECKTLLAIDFAGESFVNELFEKTNDKDISEDAR